jgi:hypothetical protein
MVKPQVSSEDPQGKPLSSSTTKKLENSSPKLDPSKVKDKQVSKKSVSPINEEKFDYSFDDLIEELLSTNVPDFSVKKRIDLLSKELQSTAQEILKVVEDHKYEISDKFRLNLLSEKTVEKLLEKTENFSLALKSFSTQSNANVSKKIRLKGISSDEELDKFLKLCQKSSIIPKNLIPSLSEEIFSSSVFRNLKVEIQVKIIAFFAKLQVPPEKSLNQLSNITAAFNGQDDSYQTNVIDNLRKWNITAAYQLLTHVDSDRIRVVLCNQLIESLSVNDIAAYFNWQSPNPQFGKMGVFKRIISPAVYNFLKFNSNLEDLLSLWPHLIVPEHGFNMMELKVKFKTLIGKKGTLPESLRDESVPVLQNEVQSMKETLKISQMEISDLIKKLEISEEINRELNDEIQELREFRNRNSKESLEAHDAIERQIKIDQLRSLIPAFELGLQGSNEKEFQKLLEEIQIEVAGVVGQKVRWNHQICESLTGEEISEGLVVQTGFTWFSGKEVIPLRRMLLKPE